MDWWTGGLVDWWTDGLLLSSTSFAAFDVDESFMQVGSTHNKLENKHRKLCNYFFYYSGWRYIINEIMVIDT